jgi:tetrahydromethanopterin S-methyltransferase subunit F
MVVQDIICDVTSNTGYNKGVLSTGYKGMRISLAQTIWMHGYCILLNPNAITSITGYKGVQSTGYKGMRISLAQTIWMHGYCIALNPNAIASNTGYKGVQSTGHKGMRI